MFLQFLKSDFYDVLQYKKEKTKLQIAKEKEKEKQKYKMSSLRYSWFYQSTTTT
jgi:hypothetical protein